MVAMALRQVDALVAISLPNQFGAIIFCGVGEAEIIVERSPNLLYGKAYGLFCHGIRTRKADHLETYAALLVHKMGNRFYFNYVDVVVGLARGGMHHAPATLRMHQYAYMRKTTFIRIQHQATFHADTSSEDKVSRTPRYRVGKCCCGWCLLPATRSAKKRGDDEFTAQPATHYLQICQLSASSVVFLPLPSILLMASSSTPKVNTLPRMPNEMVLPLPLFSSSPVLNST